MDNWTPEAKSILFLVHVEEMFRPHMPEDYGARVLEFLDNNHYDEIIVLDSQKGDGGILKELRQTKADYSVVGWSWGYAPKKPPTSETKWIIPARGHTWTYVPAFMRDRQIELQAMSVFVGGGADSECLYDWEDVLLHLSIPYAREMLLIY